MSIHLEESKRRHPAFTGLPICTGSNGLANNGPEGWYCAECGRKIGVRFEHGFRSLFHVIHEDEQ